MTFCRTLEHIAMHTNNLRVIPRLLLIAYSYEVWQICTWYMLLPKPSGEQTTFVSIIVGAMGVVTGLYFKTGTVQKAEPDTVNQ